MFLRSPLTRVLIIGFSLLLLSGCSALRLGYNNGPQLAWWWLDNYVDFSSEQAPPAKRATVCSISGTCWWRPMW